MIKSNAEKSAEVRGLENTLKSLETQMKLQQKQAQELAEAVKKAFNKPVSFDVVLKDREAATRAYEIACEVLA